MTQANGLKISKIQYIPSSKIYHKCNVQDLRGKSVGMVSLTQERNLTLEKKDTCI